jgi:hypothetical protein
MRQLKPPSRSRLLLREALVKKKYDIKEKWKN